MKKNALIFGDSYSTFQGFVPEGYATYYSQEETPKTDVNNVSQTWWHQVFEETGLHLVLNNSWSGSTIGYTGYSNKDCSQSSSFIYRLRQLIANGFFANNPPDTVFVFGGTNDSWANAPLGEIKYGDWQEGDLYFVLPAVCYFLHLLRETLPQATIYCLINTELKPEIVSCINQACEKYAMTPVTFDRIDKQNNHPTIEGMKNIRDGVLAVLKK